MSCLVTIGIYNVDLLLLSMVDFYVIFGMDWLSLYHAILNFRAKTVLAMPGFPRLKWKDSFMYASSMEILFLKAQYMVEKGFGVFRLCEG